MASVVVSMLAIQLKGYGIQSHPPCTTPTGKFISAAAPPVSNRKKRRQPNNPQNLLQLLNPIN